MPDPNATDEREARLTTRKRGLEPGTPAWSSLRPAVQLVLGLAATAVLGVVLNDTYPFRDWLFWDLARIWGWLAFFCAACVSAGNLAITALGIELPPLERLVVSMAAGVTCFVVGMYVGGALGLFGGAFAVALPGVLLTGGLPAALEPLRRTIGRGNGARRIRPAWLHAIGTASLGLLYLQCVTPDAINYDAAWTHLSIAEDYSREGRIVPFLADVAKNLPHLSSILYTWGFLVPGFSQAPLRWMMAQHLEFTLFVWTLISVVPATRWLLNRDGLHASWCAFFLFPAYYTYDANLGGAADHVAAFFALPFLMASMRAMQRYAPAPCFLAGALGGAALHTKYQCLYLMAPIIVLFAVRWVHLFVQRRRDSLRRRACMLSSPLAFGTGVLLALSPHLVRNLIFHRNPVYPLLQGFFTASTPTFPDAVVLMKHLFGSAQAPVTSVWAHAWSSLRLVFTFSFDPQYSSLGKTPIFGSVFTLMIPLILLHWRRRRLSLGLALALAATLCWAVTYRIDRNLQILLPWVVAVTAAGIAATWTSSRLARLGLIPLLSTQIVWGSTFMVAGGADRIRSTIELAQTGLTPTSSPDRYAKYRANFRALGNALPSDAVLLLHTGFLRLGIDRRTMSDWAGFQYLIDYRPMHSPRDVYERFREVGITHIAWNNHDYPSSKQEDVLFIAFTRRHAIFRGMPGGFSLWEMPRAAPPAEPPLQVLTLGMTGYGDGVYSIDKLGVFHPFPPHARVYPPPDRSVGSVGEVIASLGTVDAVLVSTTAAPELSAPLRASPCYSGEVHYYSGYSVYLRKSSPACP